MRIGPNPLAELQEVSGQFITKYYVTLDVRNFVKEGQQIDLKVLRNRQSCFKTANKLYEQGYFDQGHHHTLLAQNMSGDIFADSMKAIFQSDFHKDGFQTLENMFKILDAVHQYQTLHQLDTDLIKLYDEIHYLKPQFIKL